MSLWMLNSSRSMILTAMKENQGSRGKGSTLGTTIGTGSRKLRLRARVFTRRAANRTLNGVDYTVFNQIRAGCGRRKGGRKMNFQPERILLILTLIAITGGTALGIGLNPTTGSETTHQYIEFPGKLFLRMLKLMIVPLVISSNVSSAATVTSRATRWLTFLSLSYYILTTFAAVSIGTALALTMGPGYWRPEIEIGTEEEEDLSNGIRTRHALFSVMDLLRNMIPENAVKATFQRSQTKYDKSSNSITSAGALDAVDLTESIEMVANSTNMTTDNFQNVIRDVENAKHDSVDGANILGLICFSMFFGFGLRKVQEVDQLQHDVSAVFHFFAGLRKIMVYLVSIVIWFSPLGIMSLIAGELSKTQDLGATLRQLFMYTLTVVVGLLIHFFLVLTPLLIIVAKKNPIKFLYHMLQAIMIATGTASSLATLPATANCLENNVRLDQRVMRFMLPLGTTVNMDGTALYQIVAIIYIAQGLRISLDPGTVVYMVILVAMSSVVTASTPSAGFFTIILTMQALGMPASQAPLIIPVDWFLDRLRTPVNVMSNAIGVAVVAEISKLKMQDKVKKENKKKSLVPNPTIATVESGLHQTDGLQAASEIGNEGGKSENIDGGELAWKYRKHDFDSNNMTDQLVTSETDDNTQERNGQKSNWKKRFPRLVSLPNNKIKMPSLRMPNLSGVLRPGLLPHHRSTISNSSNKPRSGLVGKASRPHPSFITNNKNVSSSDVILRSTKAYEFDSTVEYFIPFAQLDRPNITNDEEESFSNVAQNIGASFMMKNDEPMKTTKTLSKNKKHRSDSYDLLSAARSKAGDGCSIGSSKQSSVSGNQESEYSDEGKTVIRYGTESECDGMESDIEWSQNAVVSGREGSVFLDIDLTSDEGNEQGVIFDDTIDNRQHVHFGGDYENLGYIIDGVEDETSGGRINRTHFLERF